MEKKLVIASIRIADREGTAALLIDEEGRHQAFSLLGRDEEDAPVGSIFVGQVSKMDRRTNGAFVHIGSGRMVFLPMKKNETCRDFCMITDRPKEEPLRNGDLLLVMIDGEAVKTKLPHASGKISLAGRYLVVTSEPPALHLSGRLDKETRQRLRESFDRENPDILRHCCIVRTAAKDASGDELAMELDALQAQLDSILEYGKTRTIGTCLYRPFPWKEYFDRLSPEDLVLTDREQAVEAAKIRGLSCVDRTEEADRSSLAREYSMMTLLDRLTARRVWLKSGATLLIEQTEAFVAIDVNSGKYSGSLSHEEMARKLNLEAADEAFRQIRLRNLTGVILIDFLNLNTEHETELLSHLRSLAAADPIKTTAVDITKLGIAEIARERMHRSLSEQVRRFKQGGIFS